MIKTFLYILILVSRYLSTACKYLPRGDTTLHNYGVQHTGCHHHLTVWLADNNLDKSLSITELDINDIAGIRHSQELNIETKL